MSENEELLAAIDDYELYSVKHREVLKSLAMLAIDDIAPVTIAYLVKLIGVSSSLIYKIIKQLEKDGFISRTRISGTSHDSFKLDRKNLQKIIKLYNSKKLLMSAKNR